jgi:hypothetical protein
MRQLPLPTQQHSQSALDNLKPSTACSTVPTGSSLRRSGHGLLLAQQVDLQVQGLDLQFGLYVHLVSALDDKAQAPKCIRDRAGYRRRVSMFTEVCLNGCLNPGSPFEALLVEPAKGTHVRRREPIEFWSSHRLSRWASLQMQQRHERFAMGFRFQKRIRLFKGLTLNLSKSGTSWTVGGPGASVNVRGDKVTGTVGAPGTGLSYRQKLGDGKAPAADEPAHQEPPYRGKPWRGVLWMVLMALGLYLVLR